MSQQLKLILTTDLTERQDRFKTSQSSLRYPQTSRNEINRKVHQTKFSIQKISFLDSPKFSQIPQTQILYRSLKGSLQIPTTLKQKKSETEQENFIIKQYWRNLARWQGFDDYLYLRNPINLRIIKGREILSKNDIVEPLNTGHGMLVAQGSMLRAEEGLDEYKSFIRRQQLGQSIKLFQPGEVNYNKFNPQTYKLSYQETMQKEFPMRNEKQNGQIEKIIKIITHINERLIVDEITGISQFGERMLRTLWKIGCLNLFLMGSYIHNLLLNLYGKEKLAYSNWKKILRICNIQGNSCHKFKQVAYKHLSKVCIKLQLYDKSLIYLKKLLKLSWIVGDTNYELYTYDKISLSYYYKQDIEKAIFYHERFTQGEFEQPNQGLRTIGEVNYLLNAKLKENQIDQNSYTEDEFDLDALLNKGNFNKWELQNKRKDLHINNKQGPIEYKKGHSFGKISRNSNDSHDFRQAKIILHEYQNRQKIPLGPLFEKEEKCTSMKNNQSDKSKQCQFFINQKSTNREASNFLLQDELKEHPMGEQLCFKPQENIFYIKKLLKVFQFDLRYFMQNNKLFLNGTSL